MKTILVKLQKASAKSGPFSISLITGEILLDNVSKRTLINGVSVSIDDSITHILISSTGVVKFTKSFPIETFTVVDYANVVFHDAKTSHIWKHLDNIKIYNIFYNSIEPYIIEYPFRYNFQDEILQSIQDYTKAFVYLDNSGKVFDYNTRLEVDNRWFNKAIIYNGQQSTGLLELVPKPLNNLKEYMLYPKYTENSKIILYSKSDNFYQYNDFWALNKSIYNPLFISSCDSLSIDKEINDDNMDYSRRPYLKSPMRAKDVKVRHILDNTSDLHLVSQFIIGNTMKSFK